MGISDEELIEQVERKLFGERWKSQDGREMLISQMGDQHLLNSIRMIQRGRDASGNPTTEWHKSKLVFLLDEAKSRKLELLDPEGPPRQDFPKKKDRKP